MSSNNNNKNNQIDYRLTPVKNGVIATPIFNGGAAAGPYDESMVFTNADDLREFLNDEFCVSFNFKE